jgi:hypothetical protein
VDSEILSWFGNLLNFTIFYIFSENLNSICLSNFEMSLSLFGLGASIFIQAAALLIKQNLTNR